ncbi:SapC family protein [Alteromonas pelagimontana]|nr:SapC family protein [Alteromonas pelagimontana]
MVALHYPKHANIKVQQAQVEAVGAKQHIIPVVVSEFAKLIVHYPIVFTQNDETGEFKSFALTGFEEGENLFWQGGRWNGIYIPIQIERHPFFVAQEKTGEGKAKHTICVDSSSNAISEEEGDAIFDNQGKATTLLKEKKQMLAQWVDGQSHTKAFITAMQKYDLITPLSLDIVFLDKSKTIVNGLYTVDEDKLAALDAQALKELQQEKWLAPAYTVVASNAQIYNLIDRKNKAMEHGKAWFN